MHDIARKMRGPDGTARVLVLDVDFSSTKYRIYLRETASRHAYYFKPPEGMHANDFKRILDDAGGEDHFGFRYWVYPELHTDLKPILTADPFAGKYFGRDNDRRYLQIEGERKKAREAMAELLTGLKDPFDPKEFPEIQEFALTSIKAEDPNQPTELVLLRTDHSRNALRRSEDQFYIAVCELGYAREIDIHRPILAESETVLYLTSNDNTTGLGFKLLSDLATYLQGPEHTAKQQEVKERPAQDPDFQPVSPYIPHSLTRPRVATPVIDEAQLLARAAQAMKEQIGQMKLLKNRTVTQAGPHVTIKFSGGLFAKGPSEPELRELASVYRMLQGDPTLGHNWFAYYQFDKAKGDFKILTTTTPTPLAGWSPFRTDI
jgi:hypothetical protein